MVREGVQEQVLHFHQLQDKVPGIRNVWVGKDELSKESRREWSMWKVERHVEKVRDYTSWQK